jgi:hypothetical protein
MLNALRLRECYEPFIITMKKMQKREKIEVLEGKNVTNATVSLPPDLLAWIDEQADADDRSRSQWVTRTLDAIRKQQMKAAAATESGTAVAKPVPPPSSANTRRGPEGSIAVGSGNKPTPKSKK